MRCILGGTRTLNLEIRSLTPYPLGHEDTVRKSRVLLIGGIDPPRSKKVPPEGVEPSTLGL